MTPISSAIKVDLHQFVFFGKRYNFPIKQHI